MLCRLHWCPESSEAVVSSLPSAPSVRSVDSTLTPAISIREMGAVGATKPERTGIIKLKSEIKQVRRAGLGWGSQEVLRSRAG